MDYSKAVVQYFNEVDTREQEDLANQIEEGAYSEELSSARDAEVDKLIEDLRANNILSESQLNLIRNIDHIGAIIILASKEL